MIDEAGGTYIYRRAYRVIKSNIMETRCEIREETKLA
jgi:hypothetical protein